MFRSEMGNELSWSPLYIRTTRERHKLRSSIPHAEASFVS